MTSNFQLTNSSDLRRSSWLALGSLVPCRFSIQILTGLQSEIHNCLATMCSRFQIHFLTWHNVLATSFGPLDDLIRSFCTKMSRLRTLIVQIVAVFLAALGLSLTIRCTQYDSKCNHKQQKFRRHSHFAQLIYVYQFCSNSIYVRRLRTR